MQVIFLLQNPKGMLEEHKSREKGNRLINKIRANKKAAHVVCSLRKEVGWGGVLNFKHLSLSLHMHFSFLGFLSPSVRIMLVFLVAKPTQEIK